MNNLNNYKGLYKHRNKLNMEYALCGSKKVVSYFKNYFEFISDQRFTPTRQEIDKAEIALRNNLKTSNKQLMFLKNFCTKNIS